MIATSRRAPPPHPVNPSTMRVLIADDNNMNAKLMKRKALSLNASLNVELVESAEEVMNIFEHFDLIITDNDFGPDLLKGSDAIQRIREHEREKSTTHVIIALWTVEKFTVLDAPSADLIWDKAIAPNEMQAQLLPLMNINM